MALWHVSNELGCHNALCHCDESTARSAAGCATRYGTIDELNRAWGTSFWSQRYTDWNEILPPRLTVSTRNPGQVLDFHRFSSDELLGYYRAEAEVIRRHSALPITTNFMVTAHIRNLDYWSWAPEMDVVANDHYLDHRLGDPRTELAFAADLTRGLAGGAPWLLMEHSTGSVNWQPVNLAKEPGQMLRNSLAHVARGADAVCFFQWRASLQGSEKFHSALVPHAGTDSALWREVVELGAHRRRARRGRRQPRRRRRRAALLLGVVVGVDAEIRPTHAIEYLDQVHALYGALHDLGVTVDVVRPGADLTATGSSWCPACTSCATRRPLRSTPPSPRAATPSSRSTAASSTSRPGATRRVPRRMARPARHAGRGVRPVLPGTPIRSSRAQPRRCGPSGSRRRMPRCSTASPTAPPPPRPAITRRTGTDGAGDAWYLGTLLDRDDLRDLVGRALEGAGVASAPAARPTSR